MTDTSTFMNQPHRLSLAFQFWMLDAGSWILDAG
jgi:hypothetical protein